MLVSVLMLQGVTGGGLSEIKMRHIGMQIMPNVDEQHVQSNIQTMFAQSSVIPIKNRQVFDRIQHRIHDFAEFKLVHLVIYIATIPMFLGMIDCFIYIFKKSKHSTLHTLEGIFPLVFVIGFVAACYQFSEITQTKPLFMMFALAPYYCLQNSRLIVATVSKQLFTIKDAFSLSVPMILSIAAVIANGLMGHPIPENILFLVILLVGLFSYFHYIVNTINQITEHLDICCLTIKHKSK